MSKAREKTMSVTIFYDVHATPGNADELLAVLLAGRDFGITVPGCEAYEVFQAEADPHRLMMVERWASADAHQQHFERNVVASGVLDKAIALMIEPPQPPVYCVRR
jgi:quinol monooxygenase YgiN